MPFGQSLEPNIETETPILIITYPNNFINPSIQ